MTARSLDVPRIADRAAERVERLRHATGRSPLGRIELVRAILEEPRWLVPLFLVAYVLYVTWNWEFPNWQGVPFPPVWLASALVALTVWLRLGRVFTPVSVTAIVVVTAMLATDVTLFWSQSLRDLQLYVKAGDTWLNDGPVYSYVPLIARPIDLSNYPFLYPPVTLPLFGALSVLPLPVAAMVWVGASLLAVLYGFRRIGLDWRWSLLLIAWPPVAQGLYVGNVAVPLFALFAAAIALPALLAIPPIFKLYSGVASLWLLRREHWRDLALGLVAVGGACAASVVVMGVDLWASWLRGLLAFQVSQRNLPEFLYGFGLGLFMPLAVQALLAIAVTILAVGARERRDQLGRLGVATVVASPSLYAHGWLVALPGLVRLDTIWFWLAFGLTACAPGIAWFVTLMLIVGAWYVPAVRKRPVADPWHPLGSATMAWPQAADLATVERPAIASSPPAAPASPARLT
jgi:hypothetical protein